MDAAANERQDMLVGVPKLEKLTAISKRTIFRLNASGKLPRPIRIGGAIRWRLSDIHEWIRLSCPNRRDFEARMDADRGSE